MKVILISELQAETTALIASLKAALEGCKTVHKRSKKKAPPSRHRRWSDDEWPPWAWDPNFNIDLYGPPGSINDPEQDPP